MTKLLSGRNRVIISGVIVLAVAALTLAMCRQSPNDTLDFSAPTASQTEPPTATPGKVLDDYAETPSRPTITATQLPTPTPTHTPTPTFDPQSFTPEPTATALTMLPPGGAAAASGLAAQAQCGANGVAVTFTWVPGRGITSQAVDVSNFNNDFLTGTFRFSDPLPAEARSYLWDALPDGVLFTWRVRSQVDSGWAASETMTIETPFCGGDSARP